MGLESGLLLLGNLGIVMLLIIARDEILKLGIGSCLVVVVLVVFLDDISKNVLGQHLMFLGIVTAHIAKGEDGSHTIAHAAVSGSTGNLVEHIDVVLHGCGGGLRHDATEAAGLEVFGQKAGLHLGGDAGGGPGRRLDVVALVVFGLVDQLFDLLKVELIAYFGGQGAAVGAALVVMDVDFEFIAIASAGIIVVANRGERIAKVGRRGGAQAGIAPRFGTTASARLMRCIGGCRPTSGLIGVE